MSEIFNHIFSLQHVYQVQYVMLHTWTRIDKTGKILTVKIVVSRRICIIYLFIIFFWGGGPEPCICKKHVL